MSNIKDITNQRFGKLVALNPTSQNKNKRWYWKCKCDCGKYKEILSKYLLNGHTKSCGCSAYINHDGKYIDIIGEKFGKLKVIAKTKSKATDGSLLWNCKCECGCEILTTGCNLRSGHTKSCGCLRNIELIGKTFGKLKVIDRKYRDKKGHWFWECKCDCGNKTIVSTGNLRSGHTSSCGCKCIAQEKDITGKKFGRLTAIKQIKKVNRSWIWACECECGRIVSVRIGHLISGKTVSCGCYSKERAKERLTIHGKSNIPGFYSWLGMINRCYSTSNPDYLRYKLKNITVYEPWINSVDNFLKDMGEKPGEDYWFWRIDKEKGFTPDNCIWKQICLIRKIKKEQKIKKAMDIVKKEQESKRKKRK